MTKFSSLLRNVFAASICIVAAAAVTSCDRFNQSKEVYIPVQQTEDGAWYFINSKGERVGDQDWEFEPTCTMDGLFTARDAEGLTVYEWKGDKAEPIDTLKNLVSVGVMKEGLMPICRKMERITIVDRKGDLKFTLEPIDGKEITSCSASFSDGLLVVRNEDYKAGVVNDKGEVLVKPRFSDISQFDGGFALAVEFPEDNWEDGPKYYIIDKESGVMKPVTGKFGNPEGECYNVPQFHNGVAYIDGMINVGGPDEYDYVSKVFRLTTDGTVSELDKANWVQPVENGGCVISYYSDNESIQTWKDPEGKTVLQVTESGMSLFPVGQHVVMTSGNRMDIYNLDGTLLNSIKGADYFCRWTPDGFDGVIAGQGNYPDPTTYVLFDAEGKEVPGARFYGIGTSETISLGNDYDEVGCGMDIVTSAYLDVTAAASKIVSMATGSIDGTDGYYYLGEPVSNVINFNNYRYYSGYKDDFYISVKNSNGTGYWINVTGYSSGNITSYNPYAKIAAFDIALHTTHPSGLQLREAIGRRLKKDGYSVTKEEANYTEYSNGYHNILVYGTAESKGAGAVSWNSDSYYYMSDTDKASKAANLN